MSMQNQNIDVHIDVFEGPMDLLVHLIDKNNLDIRDIPIAQITKEYLEYIELFKTLNLEIAGEFLVMAATLMQIKAKSLLPGEELPNEDEGPDPKIELIQKIAEYQKFKEVSKFLGARFEEFKDVYYRETPSFGDDDKILKVQLFELLDAVKRAFSKIPDSGSSIRAEQFPIEKYMDKITGILSKKQWIVLDDLLAEEKHRMGIITCFMAMLELMKIKKVIAAQDANFKEIRLYARPGENEADDDIKSENAFAAEEDGVFASISDKAKEEAKKFLHRFDEKPQERQENVPQTAAGDAF